MNKYIITIEKSNPPYLSWWGYEIEAEDIETAIEIIEDSPNIWGDCDEWEIISIHKQWKTGGQMVMEVHAGRLS